MLSTSALIKPVCGPGCPAQPLCTCVPPCAARQTAGASRGHQSQPCHSLLGSWPCLTLLAAFLHLALPFALGIPARGEQQPCRNRVSPAAAGQRSRCEPAHVLQEERLGGTGAIASPALGFSPLCPHPLLTCHPCPHGWQLWHSLNAFCSCPGLCTAF